MVFYGEYEVSFTGKGRLVLPIKVRELLTGNIFVISKGFDHCLTGYDKSDWESRARELMGVSLLEKDNLEKRRFVFSSASYLEIDDQGRFVLPKNLTNYAELTEKAVVVGVGDHFEVWKKEKWEKYQKEI